MLLASSIDISLVSVLPITPNSLLKVTDGHPLQVTFSPTGKDMMGIGSSAIFVVSVPGQNLDSTAATLTAAMTENAKLATPNPESVSVIKEVGQEEVKEHAALPNRPIPKDGKKDAVRSTARAKGAVREETTGLEGGKKVSERVPFTLNHTSPPSLTVASSDSPILRNGRILLLSTLFLPLWM